MKRSEINAVYREAQSCFRRHHWHYPDQAPWDITDFGLGDFDNIGLTLINLADEPEYCEKLMYARPGQLTPAHTHRKKKEDIICRTGKVGLKIWPGHPDDPASSETVEIFYNGRSKQVRKGTAFFLEAGDRITLHPGIFHSFWAELPDTILGEVSTANDDENDNIFADQDIGRFPGIVEDEPSLIQLISEQDV